MFHNLCSINNILMLQVLKWFDAESMQTIKENHQFESLFRHARSSIILSDVGDNSMLATELLCR